MGKQSEPIRHWLTVRNGKHSYVGNRRR